MLSQPVSLEGERKIVTVLFVDIKDSVALSASLGMESWHFLLDAFFRLLADGVHRFGGIINQYTGDGVMALFGAPVAHEDHGQRACFSALYLRDRLRAFEADTESEFGVRIAVRMGINTGPVVVGTIGDDLRMDYTAQGQTVGHADRLQKLAEPGTVLLGDSTARDVDGYVRLRSLGTSDAVGAGEGEPIHAMIGLGSVDDRFAHDQSLGLSPFVGRGRDLEDLKSDLRSAEKGIGTVVRLRGEAGIGKTRLVHEFFERATGNDVLRVMIRGTTRRERVSYDGIRALLRALLGVPAAATEDVRERLTKEMGRRGIEVARAAPVLAEILVPSDPTTWGEGQVDVPDRVVIDVLEDIVTAVGRDRPIAMCLDDADRLDPASERLIRGLLGRITGKPVRLLAVATARDDDLEDWSFGDEEALREIGPLSREETSKLAEELLGKDPSTQQVRADLVGACDGNPFFLDELVRALVERGSLAGMPGAYLVSSVSSDLALPDSVRGVLSSRIDRLPLLEKRVLYAAAIVGRTFTADRVAMLVDDASEPEILDALQALRLADFIEEQWLSQKPAFKFKHFLTLEVAYQTQLIAHRRRAHARLAEAITSAQLEPEGEQSALVASHWERADRPFHAAQAWARAAPHEPLGDRLRVWERVRELLSREESAGEAKSLELTAVAQSLSLGWSHGLRGDEAQSLFDRGVELTRGEPNETTVRAILHAHFGRTRLSTEGAPSYVQSLEHALTHARNVEWPLLADGISAGLCQGLAYSGELPRALALADEVLPRLLSSKGSGFKQSGFDISPDLWLRAVRAEVLALMGRHADSATELDDVIEESLRTGQIELLVLPRFTKLRLEWLRDAPAKDDPVPLAEATLRVARDLGSDRSLVMAHGAMGIAAQLAGDPERAAREFTTALELTRDRLAGPELEPLLASHLADARLGMGDAREASASARAAVGTARERGLRVFECMASIELARAALLTESSAVESIAQDCMRLCEQTAAHALRGRLERLVLAAT